MNNQMLEDMEVQIKDKTKTMQELVKKQFGGLTYGTREVRDDREFLDFYMMRVAEDPLWQMAIQDFPEGRRMNERFLRLMGFDLKGMSDDAAIG